MIVFELLVNGEPRFRGQGVRAVTLVSDWIAKRSRDRVQLHVGAGEPGFEEVHHLGADLVAGDEITIRLLDEAPPEDDDARMTCSFCARDHSHFQSLVSGPRIAICDTCVASFGSVLYERGPLPLGTSVHDRGDLACGFCLKTPPDVPGLLVRNGAGICPECVRVCADIKGTR